MLRMYADFVFFYPPGIGHIRRCQKQNCVIWSIFPCLGAKKPRPGRERVWVRVVARTLTYTHVPGSTVAPPPGALNGMLRMPGRIGLWIPPHHSLSPPGRRHLQRCWRDSRFRLAPMPYPGI